MDVLKSHLNYYLELVDKETLKQTIKKMFDDVECIFEHYGADHDLDIEIFKRTIIDELRKSPIRF